MAFTLTAATAAISLTLVGILGLWSLGLDVKHCVHLLLQSCYWC